MQVAAQAAAQVAVAAVAAAAVVQVRGTRGRALKVVTTVAPLTRGLTTEAAAGRLAALLGAMHH